MRNASLKFVCRDVYLRVESNDSLFTRAYGKDDVLRIPVAHHDGNYFSDETTIDRLEDNGQVAFRYCDESGAITGQANPNGSLRNIAGVYNEAKTVLGMMPHPERLAETLLGGTDGRPMFDGIVEALG